MHYNYICLSLFSSQTPAQSPVRPALACTSPRTFKGAGKARLGSHWLDWALNNRIECLWVNSCLRGHLSGLVSIDAVVAVARMIRVVRVPRSAFARRFGPLVHPSVAVHKIDAFVCTSQCVCVPTSTCPFIHKLRAGFIFVMLTNASRADTQLSRCHSTVVGLLPSWAPLLA